MHTKRNYVLIIIAAAMLLCGSIVCFMLFARRNQEKPDSAEATVSTKKSAVTTAGVTAEPTAEVTKPIEITAVTTLPPEYGIDSAVQGYSVLTASCDMSTGRLYMGNPTTQELFQTIDSMQSPFVLCIDGYPGFALRLEKEGSEKPNIKWYMTDIWCRNQHISMRSLFASGSTLLMTRFTEVDAYTALTTQLNSSYLFSDSTCLVLPRVLTRNGIACTYGFSSYNRKLIINLQNKKTVDIQDCCIVEKVLTEDEMCYEKAYATIQNGALQFETIEYLTMSDNGYLEQAFSIWHEGADFSDNEIYRCSTIAELLAYNRAHIN